MNVLDCEQGSAAWFQARLGSATASRVAEACAKLKTKNTEAAVRRNYRYEMVCERLTGNPSDHYVSVFMEEGKENEPLARTAYELETGASVEQVGFVFHPTIKMAGASPDGLVGTDGLVEIKCPKTQTHLEYIISGEIPESYQMQMLWQMACCERQWCDFVSYDFRMPENIQLFVKRLYRDALRIDSMERDVMTFLDEVDAMLNAIRARTKVAV